MVVIGEDFNRAILFIIQQLPPGGVATLPSSILFGGKKKKTDYMASGCNLLRMDGVAEKLCTFVTFFC